MRVDNLITSNGYNFTFKNDEILPIKEEIEDFLISVPSLKKVKFKQEIPKEIQSNNKIEGIDDDIDEINRIIKRRPVNSLIDYEDDSVARRIVNLFGAYNFILEKKEINKETLRELYNQISNGLIKPIDLASMGEYYRKDAVCITNKPYFDEKNEGIKYYLLDDYMNRLFDYINNSKAIDYTDYFVISQIIHFYFVYVHPYFDCNGRTSRIVSLWYLLNNKANAFLNFNRSIPFSKGQYCHAIESSRRTCNMTHFVKYMLKIEKAQLEKEYLISSIEKGLKQRLTDEEYLVLEYYLSNNQEQTLLSLTQLFNRVNNRSFKPIQVEQRINEFKEKGILLEVGNSSRFLRDGRFNPKYRINRDLIDIDETKIKRLQLSNYVNK